MTKIISRNRVFTGLVTHIDQFQLAFNNNRQALFELVSFQVKTGVSALPVTDTGDLLLIKHFQLGLGTEGYSLPTGGLLAGEDPMERMQLELQEEIGFSAGRLTLMARSHPLPSYLGNDAGYVYLAQDLSPSMLPGDEPYPISLHPTSLAQALDMIQSNTISDARAVLAILLYNTFYIR